MTELGNLDSGQALESGRRVLEIEARAVRELADRLDVNFVRAAQIVLGCKGRVVVSGIGKSGHIARKIASTLASTGTPAFFVHPADASHGDLGMVTRDDVMIALSNSGESGELLVIVPLIKRLGGKLIAMTGNPNSTLAREADVHLDAKVAEEACSLGLAPTASTTAALALGDALAVTLLEARGFGKEDFARSHPGGSLGRRLLTHVHDVMRTGQDIPSVPQSASFSEAILEVSRKGMGMTAVTGDSGRVVGHFYRWRSAARAGEGRRPAYHERRAVDDTQSALRAAGSTRRGGRRHHGAVQNLAVTGGGRESAPRRGAEHARSDAGESHLTMPPFAAAFKRQAIEK